MKRDLDLIRKIVLAIEDSEGNRARALTFEGYSPSQVGYHAHLLVDAGMARGIDVTNLGSDAPQALITDLTWGGTNSPRLPATTIDGSERSGLSAAKGAELPLTH